MSHLCRTMQSRGKKTDEFWIDFLEIFFSRVFCNLLKYYTTILHIKNPNRHHICSFERTRIALQRAHTNKHINNIANTQHKNKAEKNLEMNSDLIPIDPTVRQAKISIDFVSKCFEFEKDTQHSGII